mgnify:FL=1
MPERTSASDWRPARLDLLISALVALGFPSLAGFLLGKVGALVPMLLYYGAAWGVSILRRGSSGYGLRGLVPPPASFYANTGVIIATLVFAALASEQTASSSLAGVLLTAVFWATLNDASEPPLWL